tara:strand:+ start:513 stop:854 length:342 start_codon:yes stop_codon:yes gene_type:complete
MSKELSEDTKFTVSIKTLIAVAVAITTLAGGYYSLYSEIQEAKELPKPGKGIYVVDPGDNSAKETWPPSRNEYKMKDQLARQTLIQMQKEVEELKERVKELEDEITILKLRRR